MAIAGPRVVTGELSSQARGSAEAQLIEDVLSSVTPALSDRASSLVVGSELDPEFRKQAEAILGEALAALRAGNSDAPQVSVEYGNPASMVATGELRARQNRHPAESLMAAETLFGVALPFVVDYADTRADATTVVVAQVLHHAVWRRFPPGAIAYTEALRQRISTANQESRNHVARELHDRVSHNIAACIQRIELGVLDQDESADNRHFDAAAAILRTALSDVQSISFDLRQQVGSDYLDDAIQKYVDNVVGSKSDIVVASSGSRQRLPPAHAEELFMIVIEAIRNSRRHAGPQSAATVSLAWGDSELSLCVCDNGAGMGDDQAKPESLGLIGMRERAGAIGAELIVSSSASGTSIDIMVPLSAELTV